MTAEQSEHNKPVYFGATSTGGVDGATAAARSIGGADFTKQPVTAASSTEQAEMLAKSVAPAAVGDQCPYAGTLVMKRTSGTTQYTVALESYTRQDVKGGVTYNTTAGTSLTKGLSYNGGEEAPWRRTLPGLCVPQARLDPYEAGPTKRRRPFEGSPRPTPRATLRLTGKYATARPGNEPASTSDVRVDASRTRDGRRRSS